MKRFLPLRSSFLPRSLVMAALLLVVSLSQALAIDSLGARAYLPRPVNTEVHSLGFAVVEGDPVPDGTLPQREAYDIGNDVVSYNYTRWFDLRGYTAFARVNLSYSDMDGLVYPAAARQSAAGLSDPVLWLGALFYGAPAMSGQAYSQYAPGRLLAGSLAVQLPFGEYEGADALNPGGNRVIFKPEIAYTRAKGDWLWEARANAQFFTENDEWNSSQSLDQEALFGFEGHVSRTLGERGSWASLDLLFHTGGETQLAGVDQNDSQSDWALGATISWRIAEKQKLNVSYRHDLSQDNSQAETEMFAVRWDYDAF